MLFTFLIFPNQKSTGPEDQIAEASGTQARTSDHCSWPAEQYLSYCSPTQLGQKALPTPGNTQAGPGQGGEWGISGCASNRVKEEWQRKAFSLGQEKKRGKEPPSIKNKVKADI